MWYRCYGKRLLDIGLLSLLMVPALLFSLPIVLISAWVFRGRVFFRQQRLGYQNRVFIIYKFASLLPGETDTGVVVSIEERQTRWGNFLRDYSLDELPQLWNVLKGEMSFIGPRPLLPEYRSLYTPEEAVRHEVKPGLSGLAQVNGRNALSWAEKMAFDQHYVAGLNLKMDLSILFSTSGVILKGQETNYGKAPGPEPLKTKSLQWINP